MLKGQLPFFDLSEPQPNFRSADDPNGTHRLDGISQKMTGIVEHFYNKGISHDHFSCHSSENGGSHVGDEREPVHQPRKKVAGKNDEGYAQP